MKREIIDNKEFIVFNDGNIKVRFSTALNNVNYKKEDEEGKKNLEDLKEIFKVDKVVYVNQTHSSDFIDATFENFKGDRDCDSLVTTDKNTLIGVFTADCVPVIAYDKEKEVIAAIHSGWKGTYNKIARKFGKEVCNGRMLNLEKCVEIQLKGIVKKENITSTRICTYCEKEVKMHSYRQDQEKSGRLFSSIFID